MRMVLLSVLTASVIWAAPIANLFDTGRAGGAGRDANWQVGDDSAFVTDQSKYPFPAWNTNAAASWISPSVTYADFSSDEPDNTFVFTTAFNLPQRFTSAFILMQIATDNALLDVMLNGTPIAYAKTLVVLPGNTMPTPVILDATGFSAGVGTALSITDGFLPGENTLAFHVRNSATNLDNDGNPTGILATFSSDVAVVENPEPGTFVMLAGALALFCSARAVRRRRLAKLQ